MTRIIRSLSWGLKQQAKLGSSSRVLNVHYRATFAAMLQQAILASCYCHQINTPQQYSTHRHAILVVYRVV